MHPHISLFPSNQFYDGRLEDAQGVSTRCSAPWHKNSEYPPYAFLNVEWGKEQRGSGHSLYNPKEVAACINFIEKLCGAFPDVKVSVSSSLFPLLSNQCIASLRDGSEVIKHMG
jgi:senataxin